MDYLVEKKYIRNIDHLKENLGALDWKMERSDIDLLTKHFPKIAEYV